MDAGHSPIFRMQETRHDNWREAVAAQFLPLDFEVARSTRFHGRGLWAQVDQARAAEIRMCEHRVTRQRSHLAAAEGPAVKLLWLLSGSGRLQRNGGECSLQADRWLFYDAIHPYSLQLSEDARFISLLYTGDNAERWMRLARDLGSAPRQTAGPARIALLALRGAMREKEGLDAFAQRALLESVLALTESALHKPLPDQGSRQRDALRLVEARRFVLQHLANAELGPDDIARALHVSRRSLYNLFAEAGLRPREFIRNLRLEKACEALAPSSSGGDSITAIALDHGFADAAHFSRSFRERFGVSPSGYRGRNGG